MKKILLLSIFTLFMSNLVFSQTSLAPGGLAIIAYASVGTDEFCFVALTEMEAGTTVNFTDNGWQTNPDGFRSNEGTLTWTASVAVACGEVVCMNASPMALAGDGDQILVYQGPASNPTFVYAINFEQSNWVASATSSNNSAIPAGLVDGTSAVNIGTGADNGYYNGTGGFATAAAALAAISNSDNWDTNNSRTNHDPSNNAVSFTVGMCLAPLPVELTSFFVKTLGMEVFINWITASELNNSHFEIQHSIDGANFRAIDEVIGNGTTQEKQAYSYTHATPANGTNYYRLKQVDYDGAFEYSDIRVVEIKRAGKIVINPSAAIAEITIRLAETTGDNNLIGIYDMMGRTVMMSAFDGTLDAKTIDISNLEKGYYVVRVQAGSEVFTERFMKMVD